MKRIYINRTYYGFGDWVMFGSVIKMINNQFPDRAVHFNLQGLSSWLTALMSYSDIKAYATINQSNPVDYDYHVNHLVYRPAGMHGNNLIHDMVLELNRQTGLGLEYEPNTFMCYRGPKYDVQVHRPYVVLPSQGNTDIRSSVPKEWGSDGENWDDLALLLKARGIPTIQVGSGSDVRLKNVTRSALGASFPAFHGVVADAGVVVALQNGLMHYAGHQGVRTYTIYRYAGDPTRPCHTQYPNQIPLVTEYVEPEEVCERIMEYLKTKGQEYGCI